MAVPKLKVDMKRCEELQSALDAARAMLHPPGVDAITGLVRPRMPGESAVNAPEAREGVMAQIREIEQAMREAGCPIS